jgi:hypothetical protein
MVDLAVCTEVIAFSTVALDALTTVWMTTCI